MVCLAVVCVLIIAGILAVARVLSIAGILAVARVLIIAGILAVACVPIIAGVLAVACVPVIAGILAIASVLVIAGILAIARVLVIAGILEASHILIIAGILAVACVLIIIGILAIACVNIFAVFRVLKRQPLLALLMVPASVLFLEFRSRITNNDISLNSNLFFVFSFLLHLFIPFGLVGWHTVSTVCLSVAIQGFASKIQEGFGFVVKYNT